MKTIAELKRLPIGTKLTLVQCAVGPVHMHRTLTRVESKNLVLETPEGTESYVRCVGVLVHPTSGGFEISDTALNLLAAYQYGHQGDHDPRRPSIFANIHGGVK